MKGAGGGRLLDAHDFQYFGGNFYIRGSGDSGRLIEEKITTIRKIPRADDGTRGREVKREAGSGWLHCMFVRVDCGRRSRVPGKLKYPVCESWRILDEPRDGTQSGTDIPFHGFCID